MLIFGCNEIKDFPVRIEQHALDKLNQLQKIEVVRATQLSFFDIRCEPRNLLGAKGYYVLSSDSKMHEPFAKWACPSEMYFLNCPNRMTVIPGSDSAIATNIVGDKTELSKSDVEHCVRSSIKHAVYETKATSESSSNTASWESDNG